MINKQQIGKWGIECFTLAGVPELANQVGVEWSNRMKTTMGKAFWEKKIIVFSTPIFSIADSEFQRETVFHECAHIIAGVKFRSKQGHNFNWRQIMRQVGYPNAQRCHKVNVNEIRSPRMNYPCDCGAAISLTKRILVHILKKEREYRCRQCRQPIIIDVRPNATYENGTAIERALMDFAAKLDQRKTILR